MNIKIALSNLKDLCLCFDNNDIEYWLSCGTLLGVIREGGLINHDNDVDVCVNSLHLNGDLVRQITNFGFKIKNTYGELEDGFEITIERFGEKIDLFFFYKKPGYWYHSVYANFNKGTYDKFDYVFEPFELRKIDFDGYSYSIPFNPEIVIEQQYGPNWRKPDKMWSYYKSPFNLKTIKQKCYSYDSKEDFKRLQTLN